MTKRLDPPTITRFGLVLRPWQRTDAAALREACGDAQIMRFTTVPGTFSQRAATEWIDRQHQRAEDGTGLVLAVTVSNERLPIGMIGLYGLDRRDTEPTLGYWLLARARGRGVATAAARALTGWAFDALAVPRLAIDREPANLGSAKVAENLGAHVTGTRHVQHEGATVELVRHVIYRPSS